MIRGIITLILLLAFVGLIIWVFSPRNRKRFEEDAKLPFSEEDKKDKEKNKEDTHDE